MTPTSSTGRDHWAGVFSAVFAGGGVQGGQVIGRSDKTGCLSGHPRLSIPPTSARRFTHALGIAAHRRSPRYARPTASAQPWRAHRSALHRCIGLTLMARKRRSAGLLLYRRSASLALEVFLAHPGGPYFAHKNEGCWTIPKGVPEPDEPLIDAAKREFAEETSLPAPDGPYLELGDIIQKGGKVVHAWACPGEADPALVRSNTCTVEWPPKSGRMLEVPEVDRCAWFDLPTARLHIKATQIPLLDRLEAALG